LAARVRAQDVGEARTAFAALYELYKFEIFSFLLRNLKDHRQHAEDLLQQTFLQAWCGRSRLAPGPNLRAWLFRIASNLVADHWRRRGGWKDEQRIPWEALEGGHEHAVGAHTTTTPFEDRAGTIELIITALGQLSPQQRNCLLLRCMGGFSEREVAEMLRITQGAVAAHVSRGRERFRHACARLLQESGCTPGGLTSALTTGGHAVGALLDQARMVQTKEEVSDANTDS
jgi:RNA polymerase sigma-70 factor (ECF subfamily)